MTAALLGMLVAAIGAQELSPRAYWPAPKGTMVAVLGYSYSTGDIVTDPSLPISGVDSRIHTGFLGYGQTLNLFGRTANLLVELSFVSGKTVADPDDTPKRIDVSGIADLGVTLSVNLLGAPSMSVEGFQQLRANPHPILGTSVKILAPTGVYKAEKLINIGTNRWAFKPELGFTVPVKSKWLLELELGTWIFADNTNFLGVTRSQKPVLAAEIHLVRRINPGFWASLDLNFFTGGRTTIDGEARADLQRDSKFGVTIVYPFAGRHAVKAGFSTGVVSESGKNFKSFFITYQLILI
jgi:hypothetical protein